MMKRNKHGLGGWERRAVEIIALSFETAHRGFIPIPIIIKYYPLVMKLTYYQNHSSKATINPQRTVSVKPKKNRIECKGTLYVIDERYSDLKFINNGAYGCVSSALDQKTSKRVAIKKVISAFQDLVDGKRILREIRLLSKSSDYPEFMKHPNIISLIDVDLP